MRELESLHPEHSPALHVADDGAASVTGSERPQSKPGVDDAGRKHPETSVIEAPAWVPRLIELVDNLRFGSLELTVHDGKVTTIERREKRRLEY
jgi:hypothetical protein